MDEGMLWSLGGRLRRRLMRSGAHAVPVVLIFLLMPE
jgi:hypothetical protein